MGLSSIERVDFDYSFDPKAPVDLGLNSSPPAVIEDVNYYTPEGKIYFGSDTGAEIINPEIGLATLTMTVLSLTEGMGTYLGNNFIALASIVGAGDDAMGIVDKLGVSWGSLFQTEGFFSDLNNMSMVKYNDQSWQITSSLGHAISVGGVRFLCDMIPGFGPFLSNAFTFGDGFGTTYRLARENGQSIESASIFGALNGAVQAMSFGFSGVGTNAAIGFFMPFFEAYVQAFNNNSEGAFFEKFSDSFKSNGGLAYLFVSTSMYTLNAHASVKMNTIHKTTDIIASDTSNAVKDFRILQGTYKVFDTPFITTALNNALTTFFSGLDLVFMASDVTSVRPI